MDRHEKGGIKRMVREECDEVMETDDFGADYAAGGYLIERKRWGEIPGRLMDSEKDLHWQLSRTVEAAEALGATPALLVEGRIGEAFEHTAIKPGRVSTYLDGATLLGVEQMLSTGKRATARKLARLEDGDPPDARRVRGTVDDPMDEPRFVLEGVRGLGPSTAEALLEEFGTVAEVARATSSQLQRADGVGPSTAESVRDAFDTEW